MPGQGRGGARAGGQGARSVVARRKVRLTPPLPVLARASPLSPHVWLACTIWPLGRLVRSPFCLVKALRAHVGRGQDARESLRRRVSVVEPLRIPMRRGVGVEKCARRPACSGRFPNDWRSCATPCIDFIWKRASPMGGSTDSLGGSAATIGGYIDRMGSSADPLANPIGPLGGFPPALTWPHTPRPRPCAFSLRTPKQTQATTSSASVG